MNAVHDKKRVSVPDGVQNRYQVNLEKRGDMRDMHTLLLPNFYN